MADVRVSGIVEESVVDGPGLRYVVFTQGCPHRCRGCHNPETHDPAGGYTLDTRQIVREFGENPLLSGITFSGGEPFLQAGTLADIAGQVQTAGRNVVCYSGFTFEDLCARARQEPEIARLLEYTDILIDGPYIEEQRDLDLPFRGSRNQRLLGRAERRLLAEAIKVETAPA